MIDQENGGVSRARNTALATAKGKWIGFIDSDDWISPNYFETMINCTTNKDLDVVVCDWIRLSQRSVIYPEPNTYDCALLEGKDANNFLQKRYMVWGALYNKKTIDNIYFDCNVKFAEDRIFNYEIMAKKSQELRLQNINAKLYYYWENPAGAVKVLTDPNWRIPLIEGLASLLNKVHDSYVDFLISFKFVQMVLLYRYDTMFNKTRVRKDNLKKYKKIGRQHMKNWPWTYRLEYTVLICCPQLFRLFKLLNDKTLIQWEKNQKLLRKKRLACNTKEIT